MTIHYHGCPITPADRLLDLPGRFFCNSFSDPRQTETCHLIGQGNMLDNGAFSVWRRGISIDWRKWAEWVEPWLDYQTTWCVLPDAIEGDEADNDRLLREWSPVVGSKGAPVWHLHESLSRLVRLAGQYPRICFGSSGAYATVRTAAWHARVSEAFDAIADERGRVPWVHMLRGMALSGSKYPFGSVDSTDVARNHNRPQNTVIGMVSRWDGIQCPPRWERTNQLELEIA